MEIIWRNFPGHRPALRGRARAGSAGKAHARRAHGPPPV